LSCVTLQHENHTNKEYEKILEKKLQENMQGGPSRGQEGVELLKMDVEDVITFCRK
jgi:hypothetical protein